ncbi:MAG: type I-D CRISPR-associated protein Cas5/Csc1 [Bacillota bacterium]
MDIYRARIELLDYVFFATVERGKVYETGTFIHNYALAYALRLVASPYAHEVQKPDYAGELARLNAWGLYLTPARPVRTLYRLTQWNTVREGYGIGKKPQSIGYPDWGFARVLRPGSTFEFYVLMTEPEVASDLPVLRSLRRQGVVYMRLGKFLGKARVRFARALAVRTGRGPFMATLIEKSGRGREDQAASDLLLNWRDIATDPIACDVYPAALPTRLIANSHFADGDYYVAEFGEGDRVVLPAGMRFLARLT